MLDRTQEPPIQKIRSLNYIYPETFTSGSDMFEWAGLYSDRHPIVKLEFLLPVHKFLSDNVLVPALLARLFGRTTATYSTEALAEKIDFYGISYRVSIGDEYTGISFYALSKFATPMLELAFDIMTRTVIDRKEFEVELQRSRYSFHVNMEKTDYVARREFYRSLLDGYKVLQENDFDKISIEDCRYFYEQYFSIRDAVIVLSGHYEETHVQQVRNFLQIYPNKEKIPGDKQPLPRVNLSYKCVEKQNAKQSTVVTGCVTINRKHPDYFKLAVANTVLGGYFGSRLSRNIREDKGYTYGVFSTITQRKDFGIFRIESDIGSEYREEYMKEVKKEIERLKNEPVPENELELVKNYIGGTLLSGFDGVFEQASLYASLRMVGLDFGYYDRLLENLDTITGKDIMEVVTRFLDFDKMVKIVAGTC